MDKAPRKPLRPTARESGELRPTRRARLGLDRPGYVELTDADRRAAVAAFASILAAWWQLESVDGAQGAEAAHNVTKPGDGEPQPQ